LSDALHLASDLIGYFVAMTAVSFSTKRADKRMTYGWHRAELVGTLISICSIWMMSLFLVKEAYARLWQEPEVLGGRMLIVAVAGLIFNVI
jgi:zinc transporter 2